MTGFFKIFFHNHTSLILQGFHDFYKIFFSNKKVKNMQKLLTIQTIML
jgi:hypothetical protein